MTESLIENEKRMFKELKGTFAEVFQVVADTGADVVNVHYDGVIYTLIIFCPK